MFNERDFRWRGLDLIGPHGELMADVVPDQEWPELYRVRTAHDGRLSDMVNLTRAKDAAIWLVARHLNKE